MYKKNSNTITALNGIRIVTDSNMVEPGAAVEIKRTWKERLFTRPWKPFKTVKTIIPLVPITKVFMHDDGWIMHPDILEELKKQMDKVE